MSNKKFPLASLLSNLEYRTQLLKAEIVEAIRSTVEDKEIKLSEDIKVSLDEDHVPMDVVRLDKDNVYFEDGSEYSLTDLSVDDLNAIVKQVFNDLYPDTENEVA